MAQLEIKKMKQGMSYSCKEKTIILNVFKYFRLQLPEKCVTEIVRRTAKATGCSEKSIFQFRKEEASAEGFKEPSKTKTRKNININSRDIKYGNNVRQAIRYIVYDLKYRNIVPSLNTILKRVNEDTNLPNFSLMTLRRLLFDMGFYYEKNGNKSILVDKAEGSFANKQSQEQDKQPNIKNTPTQNVTNHMSNNMSNEMKPLPNIPQNNSTNMQPINHVHHQPMREQQQPRFMPMHLPQPENHVMPPMHVPQHMPMMLNNTHNTRRDFMPPPNHMMPSAPAMEMPMKVDMPQHTWMHHPHHIVKEQ